MNLFRLGIAGTLAIAATAIGSAGQGWAADITAPFEFADVWTGTGSAEPRSYVALGDLVIFSADDGVSGRELWVHDTTTDATTMIEIVLGPVGGNPLDLTPAGGRVFFSASDGTGDYELWKTDGTPVGTQPVKNINTAGSSAPWGMAALGDQVVFAAKDTNGDHEPWVSDGTAPGTVRLADINATGSSHIGLPVLFEGELYFSAYDGAERPLWKTDGTPGGTQQVTIDGTPDRASELAVLGDMLLFNGDRRLWKTDGSTAGTVLLDTAAVGGEADNPTTITASGDHAFFYAPEFIGHEDELWVTDGTDAGTRTVSTEPNVSGDPIGSLRNGSVVFPAQTDDDGEEPWVSDGTAAGTRLLADLVVGSDGSDPRGMVAHNGFVFFSAVTAALGEELYVTSGATVDLVADINTGGLSGVQGGNFEDEIDATILSAGARLYFTATTAGHGEEPWALDTVGEFLPLTPARIMETRSGYSTVDGLHNDIGVRPAGTTYELPVIGRAGVPVGATAVSLNVTAVLPQAPGYVTVFACGTSRPVASNINYGPGDVAPNAVLTPVGANGKVCIFTLAATDIIVDVNGAFEAYSGFDALTPARIMETRSGYSTVDGLHNDIGVRPAGTTYELPVIGRAGVPAGATAVSLNVTAVLPQAPGYVTVFACGTSRPVASNINYGPGDVAPNAVLTPVGANGKVCIFTLAATHIIVDVNGAFEAYSGFDALTPARIMETRNGYSTVDGLHNDIGVRPAGTTYELPVIGRAGVPAGATAVSLNVTAVLPQAPGYVTVFACGTSRPVASNINYGPGDVSPNAVLTPVGANGKVCIFTLAATDIIVDVNGAFMP